MTKDKAYFFKWTAIMLMVIYVLAFMTAMTRAVSAAEPVTIFENSGTNDRCRLINGLDSSPTHLFLQGLHLEHPFAITEVDVSMRRTSAMTSDVYMADFLEEEILATVSATEINVGGFATTTFILDEPWYQPAYNIVNHGPIFVKATGTQGLLDFGINTNTNQKYEWIASQCYDPGPNFPLRFTLHTSQYRGFIYYPIPWSLPLIPAAHATTSCTFVSDAQTTTASCSDATFQNPTQDIFNGLVLFISVIIVTILALEYTNSKKKRFTD